MKHFEIRLGERPTPGGPPLSHIMVGAAVTSVAILGSDFPDLRPAFEVELGDTVSCGQVVFRDRKHREIAFVAPISGTVTTRAYGPRKTLSALIITANGTDKAHHSYAALTDDAPDAIRSMLLERGLWPAYRTRPFGRIPDPDATPDAIFVNAMPPSHQVLEASIMLDGKDAEFRRGTQLIMQLTKGPVFVCHPPKAALIEPQGRIQLASFGGTRAAALTGTHIDRLYPVGPDRTVWSIGYQDVAAIGHLALTGEYNADRVVAVTGPRAHPPRLVRTCLGADLVGIAGKDHAQLLSGDKTSGRDAMYLGRYHQEICVLPSHSVEPSRRRRWFSGLAPQPAALIPTRALERALAVDILPVPLLRALSIADTEGAERLGCLALIEEDVAALSKACTSGADYGALLRDVLNTLKAEAA